MSGVITTKPGNVVKAGKKITPAVEVPALAQSKAAIAKGGRGFMSLGSPYTQAFRASPSERIGIIRQGIPAQALIDLVEDTGMTKELVITTLHFPRATINRRISKQEALPAECTERFLGIQKMIGQVEVMMAESGAVADFNAARWVGEWIEQPSPALGGATPAQYMDTIEGQEMIAALLARMQSGAYA